MHSFPNNAKPRIQWNHQDGPLLVTKDGHLHWLTLWERIKLKCGLLTIEELDQQYGNYAPLEPFKKN